MYMYMNDVHVHINDVYVHESCTLYIYINDVHVLMNFLIVHKSGKTNYNYLRFYNFHCTVLFKCKQTVYQRDSYKTIIINPIEYIIEPYTLLFIILVSFFLTLSFRLNQ